ncbi:MAG: MerC domain-containing protein [Deinococcales bacterium]|nr:MerC domain-containing protein [Chitinophagaceae bacterium]
MNFKINWDVLGISTSIACAIHCAFLPLVVTSLPLFGIDIIENIAFEYGMIFIAFVVGAYSLYHGFKKHHHKYLPFAVFTIGIACLFAKQIWHNQQLYLLIPAVFFIILAHYINYRFCRVHHHAHKIDCNH